jgi:hypothetical protein
VAGFWHEKARGRPRSRIFQDLQACAFKKHALASVEKARALSGVSTKHRLIKIVQNFGLGVISCRGFLNISPDFRTEKLFRGPRNIFLFRVVDCAERQTWERLHRRRTDNLHDMFTFDSSPIE